MSTRGCASLWGKKHCINVEELATQQFNTGREELHLNRTTPGWIYLQWHLLRILQLLLLFLPPGAVHLSADPW